MIIDFHTHAFGEKVANRAVSQLAQSVGGAIPETDGTIEGVRAHLRKHNADYAVLASIATNPHQMRAVNDFAKSVEGDGVIPFGSIHPDAPDAIDELLRIRDLGLKGIKLHPDYQQFYVDDPRMFPIYEACVKLGLIVLFHAGMDMGLPLPIHCTPERLKKIIPCFEGGTIVAAHYGGYAMWDGVLKHLGGKEIYFDTSFAAWRIPVYMARALYDNHPVERFLFGTDLPWSNIRDELLYLRNILQDEEKYEKVAGKNAAQLLGIES